MSQKVKYSMRSILPSENRLMIDMASLRSMNTDSPKAAGRGSGEVVEAENLTRASAITDAVSEPSNSQYR
jgi:hypothetical protein